MDRDQVQAALATLRDNTRKQEKRDAVDLLERTLNMQAAALGPLRDLHPDAVRKAIPVLKAMGLVATAGSDLEAFGELATALKAIQKLGGEVA